MGLFDKFKKQKQEYKSNIGLSQLGLIEHFDKIVAIIADGDSLSINRAMHMCITPESLKMAKNKLKNECKDDCKYIEIPLGIAVDNLVQQHIYDALIIYGLSTSELIITKQDLMELKDVIDSFCIMFAAVRNKMSNDKAYELMKHKIIYIIGTLPTGDMKKGDTFGFETIKRKTESGKEYESVKCFLTKESADKYNQARINITPIKVEDIKNFFGSVIIEPHRNYWIEFK